MRKFNEHITAALIEYARENEISEVVEIVSFTIDSERPWIIILSDGTSTEIPAKSEDFISLFPEFCRAYQIPREIVKATDQISRVGFLEYAPLLVTDTFYSDSVTAESVLFDSLYFISRIFRDSRSTGPHLYMWGVDRQSRMGFVITENPDSARRIASQEHLTHQRDLGILPEVVFKMYQTAIAKAKELAAERQQTQSGA